MKSNGFASRTLVNGHSISRHYCYVSGEAVIAQYDGVCVCCEKPYSAGTEIDFDWNLKGWIIADDSLTPKNEICTECFTEKSNTGECLC